MPNWMTSEVQVTGPSADIAGFRSAHICSDAAGGDMLDFNSIIPMPPELRDTKSGGYIDVLVWALGGELYAERNLLRKLGIHSAADTPITRPWLCDAGITTREELLLWAEKERPDQLDAARRTLEVERATGYRDWYDWQVDNWGCKWGCFEFMWLSDDKTAFCMDTPWSAPSPVFEKLVELYPSLTFTCHFVEPNMEIDFVETYTA